MATPKLIVPQPAMTITGLRGFENLEFTQASDARLTLPAAVAYRAEFGGSLQSADEALAIRIAANGADHANDYQINRTGTFRFIENGKVYVAVDDNADPEKNLLLARAQEGYNRNSAGKEWFLNRNDPTVKRMIERAKSEQRTYQALDTNTRLLALNGAYHNDAVVRAIIPQTAKRYESWLQKQGFTNGYVWDLTSKQSIDAGLDDTTVLARRVGVGGDNDYDGRYDLYADDRLDDCGLARRVREATRKS